MDFGVVGLDHHRHHHHHHNHHGLGISASSSSEAGFGLNNVISSSSSDPETKQRTILYGSGLSCNNTNNIKQERSAGTALEEYWRSSKVAKTGGGGGDGDDFSSVCKGMMFHQRNNNNNNNTLLRSNSNTTTTTATSTTTLSFLDNEHYNQQQQQSHQMLSFSTSPRSEAHNNATLPYFPNAISAYTTRNTAFNSGSNNNTHGGIMMMRSGGAAFTAAQWMELEHQALIYKYITANIPIPSNLLLPIRKAFDSSPFPSSALLRPNPLGVGGWGGFHLGFSNTTDPEPGRCRRTDGKKWRCSRDAVADQKYCERHMNRGRHRSRKPVEGQHGHSVAAGASTNNAAAAAANIKPVALAGGAASNTTLSTAHQQIQSFEINAASNRMFMKDDTTATPNGGLSLLSSKETSSLLFPRKQQIPYDMSSPSSRSSEYGGLVTADHHSLLVNPASQKPPQNDPSPQQSSLHQFIDDWPNKPRPASTAAAAVASCWPESDRTQLSISIPTAETNLSPLRLSRDQSSDANIRQANWIPISWETSLGGPLGEVLHQTNNNNSGGNNNGMMSDHCKSSSSTTATSSSVLNLMPEGWDNSPPMGSSPTGVLQKTAFGSLSNSSSGSSPRAAEAGSRAHHHNQEGASLSVNIDLLGGSAHLTSSSSLPAL